MSHKKEENPEIIKPLTYFREFVVNVLCLLHPFYPFIVRLWYLRQWRFFPKFHLNHRFIGHCRYTEQSPTALLSIQLVGFYYQTDIVCLTDSQTRRDHQWMMPSLMVRDYTLLWHNYHSTYMNIINVFMAVTLAI